MNSTPPHQRAVVIDINPDGSFATPARPPLSARILRAAIAVAVIAGLLALAAFAIASLLVLIPLALGAGAVGYGAWRWRLWQARRRT
jgi:CHASE2 domain-containing sensor protein